MLNRVQNLMNLSKSRTSGVLVVPTRVGIFLNFCGLVVSLTFFLSSLTWGAVQFYWYLFYVPEVVNIVWDAIKWENQYCEVNRNIFRLEMIQLSILIGKLLNDYEVITESLRQRVCKVSMSFCQVAASQLSPNVHLNCCLMVIETIHGCWRSWGVHCKWVVPGTASLMKRKQKSIFILKVGPRD